MGVQRSTETERVGQKKGREGEEGKREREETGQCRNSWTKAATGAHGAAATCDS